MRPVSEKGDGAYLRFAMALGSPIRFRNSGVIMMLLPCCQLSSKHCCRSITDWNFVHGTVVVVAYG